MRNLILLAKKQTGVRGPNSPHNVYSNIHYTVERIQVTATSSAPPAVRDVQIVYYLRCYVYSCVGI